MRHKKNTTIKFLILSVTSIFQATSVILAQDISPNLLNQGYYNIEQELRFNKISSPDTSLNEEETDVQKKLIMNTKITAKNLDASGIEVGFASFDIDQSSRKEVFVYYGIGTGCLNGCRLEIYSYRNNSWQLLEKASAVSGGVAVLKNKTNGFYDLALSNRLVREISPNFEWSSATLKWDGSRYVYDRFISRIGYDEETWHLNNGFIFAGDQLYKTLYQKEFYTVLFRPDESGNNKYYVGIFSENYHSFKMNEFRWYEIYKEAPVTDINGSYKYHDSTTNRAFVAIPFSTSKEVGITLIDDSGAFLKSNIIESDNKDRGVYDAGFLTSSNQKQSDFVYSVTDKDGSSKVLVQKVEISSLKKIGNPRVFDDKVGDRYIRILGKSDVSLESSNKFSIVRGNILSMAFAKLRDMTPDEIIPNYDLDGGDQVSNPKFKACIVAFSEEKKTNFKVLPNPNSIISILGFSQQKGGMISLPVTSFDQISVYRVNANQYSHDDLLAGKFVPSKDLLVTKKIAKIEDKQRTSAKKKKEQDCKKKKKAFEKKKKALEDKAEKEFQKRLKHLAEGEEYEMEWPVLEDEEYSKCDVMSYDINTLITTQQFTVVTLPENQILILNADAIDLVISPKSYFSILERY